MSLTERIYEGALAGSRPAIFAATLVSPRAKRAVRGRRESLDLFRDWASRERDPERPLVWVHAPSVGEALMAQAIIGALRALRPDVQIAFTHFSTSAERMVGRVGADVAGYVPFDTRRPVRRVLDALRPSAVAFVRTEVWPVLTREAAKAGAAQLLVNAVLAEDSGRLRLLGRSFLESAYRRLARVGAVSEAHADRYELLGVPPGRIHVTGDARFDQVWDRVEARGLAGLAGRSDPGPAGEADRAVPPDLRPTWSLLRDPETFTLVAGSTWPEDDAVVLPAIPVLSRSRRLRVVIAPHEPSDPALRGLERRLDHHSLGHARLSALLAGGSAPPRVVVVDRLGVLADLYALADAAYVGGGFGTDGLHSVIEPAALGVPVLFGPAHGNAREAGALAAAGGGFVVEGAGGFEDRLRELLDREGMARTAGDRARRYVESETGAARRNAELIAAEL